MELMGLRNILDNTGAGMQAGRWRRLCRRRGWGGGRSVDGSENGVAYAVERCVMDL